MKNNYAEFIYNNSGLENVVFTGKHNGEPCILSETANFEKILEEVFSNTSEIPKGFKEAMKQVKRHNVAYRYMYV